jgi:phage terminase small subunit
MSTTTPLNPRQLAFVQHYLGGMTAGAAYANAGYESRSDAAAEAAASRLLRNGKVAAAIAAARTRGAEIAAVTQADVLTGLMAEARFTGTGSSHAARVQAWTTIGKHLGMFPKVVEHEHTGPGGGPIPVAVALRGLTDDELDTIDDLLGRAEAAVPATPAIGGPGREGPPAAA